EKQKRLHMAKIDAMSAALDKHFVLILKSFPSLENLTEYYQELIRVTTDYDQLKKSFGALSWANAKVKEFSRQYARNVYGSFTPADVTKHWKSYIGRIASVIKQVKNDLKFLEEARVIMYEYPSIKSNIFTVCIAGFPNVGKSTLLGKITPAKPKIADYAFTTKSVNIGYAEIGHEKVQVIDTPGTLNRIEAMNNVERQAYLAMRYVAHLIAFVFDPTNTYTFEEQLELHSRVVKYRKPLLVYISKTDIAQQESIDRIKAQFPQAITDKQVLVQILDKKKRELFVTSGVEVPEPKQRRR
ncbi:MAG TPA: GTPase, partial [Acidobacteriota bacterium]|nr:GTPase [Acidobacteriota bacterium]